MNIKKNLNKLICVVALVILIGCNDLIEQKFEFKSSWSTKNTKYIKLQYKKEDNLLSFYSSNVKDKFKEIPDYEILYKVNQHQILLGNLILNDTISTYESENMLDNQLVKVEFLSIDKNKYKYKITPLTQGLDELVELLVVDFNKGIIINREFYDFKGKLMFSYHMY